MKIDAKKLEKLINISTNILILCDSQANIIYHNQLLQALKKRKSKEYNCLDNFFSFQTVEKIKKHTKKSIQTQNIQCFDIEEKKRHYLIFISPIENNAAISIEDITERKELSNTLKEQSSRLKFAEKTAKIGYWEFDIKRKKFFWSTEISKIFGVDAKDLSGKNNIIRKYIVPQDLNVYKQNLKKLLSENNAVEGSIRVKGKDKKIKDCYFCCDFLDNKHKIGGTFQDLTDLINIQRELKKAKEDAEKANLAKSYFLAQASHDLRQPLQALAIFAHTLSETNLSKEQKEITEKINFAASNLKALMDNLLDMSKLEINTVKAHLQKFNICQLINSLTQEYKIFADEKCINLKSVCNVQIIKSDPILVERILRNFLSNALKYTKDKILMSCRKKGHTLRIMVIDNGIGIAQNELKSIFEEFYQSSNIPHNRKKGSGLGLAIVKKTAAIINGNIGVKSRINHGSCFYLDLLI